VLKAMHEAYAGEDDSRGRRALDILVQNALIAAEDGVPLCQDTGTVWVLLEVGEGLWGQTINIPADIFSEVDASLRWTWQRQGLRNSMLHDALLDRSNTNDNSPAFCDLVMNPDIKGVRLSVMLKGGGSDNASQIAMLAPADGWPAIKEFVVGAVSDKGINACPPLVIGVGIGATFDKVASLAKRALLRNIGESNQNLGLRRYEEELLTAVNGLGIGPGSLGGKATALAVNILTAPCHMASLPVAVNINCSALRSLTYELVGDF